ncbi:serine hydrolase domain-containing protein [Miniphocaeibacter massiliensis]|uniref:serine hydrolase domain-containing protein n=1 Tax=Miniphocaeibacter massiliensis TaxID=2041841 RepID=UPI000C07C1ED|nr:serine hydrolase [Miniphocaeibacter massiliensis]
MQRDYWPTDDWKFSSKGFTEEEQQNLESNIEKGFKNIAGIVVVKNGYIKYEKYFNGHNKEQKYSVASVTKSVLSSLIGISMKDGYIKTLDEKILNYFPDYKTDNPIKKDIRILDLLTCVAPYPFESINEPIGELIDSSHWMKYSLNILAANKGRRTFKYSTIGTHILSGVLTKSSGFTAREYANKELFNKIGIDIIPNFKMESYTANYIFGKNARGWQHDPQNYTIGGYGLSLTPREMAKFGFLYLNNGVWNGVKVLPNNWVEESTTKLKYDYGYLWWLYKYEDIDAYCAMGTGGRCICIIPKMDTVISIVSDYIPKARNRWIFIKKYILPLLK